MIFKKPKFWDLKKPNFLAYLLYPFTIFVKINNIISSLIQRKKFSDLGGNGFDSELNRSQIRAGFERKLQHCLVVKQKIIDKMIVIQSASESLSLQADKILYDNSIMMDKIFKNFSKLIELSK